jgi:hypothetical protein
MKTSRIIFAALVLLVSLVFPEIGAAQTTAGPNNPTAGASVTGVGTVAWSNPTNIYSDNSSYATVALATSSTISNYLQASGYGFSIPTDATISGISVTINRYASSTSVVYDNVVQLMTGGSIVGTNQASTSAWTTTTSATASYGGTSSLWGKASWTPSEINSTDFGVALSVKNTSGTNRTASVDYVTVTVTYTLAPAYFRSATSGNWGSTSTWQQSSDNSTWGAATRTPTNSDYDITILNGHTVTVAASVSTDQTTIQSGGQITVNSGNTLTVANGTGTDLTISGTVNVIGTLTTSAGSTVVNDGGIIRNSGTVTGSSSTLTFASGGKYQHNYTTTAGAAPTATWSDGSTFEVIGYTSATISPAPTNMSGQSFYDFVYNCTGSTVQMGASNDLTTIRGDLTILSTGTGSYYLARSGSGTVNIAGNLVVNSGELGLTTTASSVNTVNVSGDVTIAGGTLTMSAGTGISTLNVAGNFTHTSGTITTTSSGTGTIVFNKSGTQTYTSGGTVSNLINFTVNSGATLNLGTNVITGGGAFTLSSGATLGIGSAAGITSSGATGNIQNTGTRTFNTGASYIYSGSVAQATGNGLPATVNSLTFNNSNGVTLTSGAAVTGALGLTSGIVTGGSNTLTVGSAGSITGGSATAYVSGPLARVYSAIGTKTFPIGKGGNYRPITLNYTALTGTSTVTANQTEGALSGTPPGNTTLFADRYWTVTQSGGSAFTYNITLDGTGFTPTGDLVVVKDDAGTMVSYTPTTPNYTVSGLTSMSNFTFGDFALATTLPAAPTVLFAQGTSRSQIQMTFTDNADNESTFGIERSSDYGVTFSFVRSIGANSGSGGTVIYADTGLTAGTEYCYRVFAHNNIGSSGYSNVACGETFAPPAQRTLTVTIEGTGCSVTQTPSGATYDDSTVVTLTPVPASGWSFYSWSGTNAGDIVNTVGVYTIVMTANKAVTANFVEAGTVSLVASEDTYLSSYNVTYNYGSVNLFKATVNSSGTNRGALLKWDLSSIPSNAVVTSVSMQLYVSTSSTATYNLYNMRRTWVEGTLTTGAASTTSANWNTYDGSSSWGTVGAANTSTDRYSTNLWGAGSTSFSSGGSKTVALNSDGIAVVQGWIDGSVTNYGVTIQNYSTTSGSDDLQVSSSENTTVANRPTLIIAYAIGLTPPSAPSGLTATAAAVGAIINLGWTDNSSNEQTFAIQRSTDGGSTFSDLGSVGPNVTLYADPGLTGGATYYYRVRAANGGGNSGWSNPASATISQSPGAPVLVAPTNAATDVSTSPSLQVTVTDPESDAMTVTFYGRPKNVDGNNFTVIALPDAQNYTSSVNGGTPAMFTSQTQWCVNNATANNIVFVAQLGDITNDNSTTAWTNANTSMTVLESPSPGLPYGIAIGNHDVPGSSLLNNYFPPSRFSGRAYFGGTYASGDYTHNYELFSAGGMDFIVVHLGGGSIAPAAAVLHWADGLLRTYSERRAIVVHHSLLNVAETGTASWTTPGQAIYDSLQDNSNLFLMLCGHNHGEGRRTDTGTNGNTIYTLLSDYQGYTNGGNGYLRIMQFSPAGNSIAVTTYSPYLGTYESDASSAFTLSYDMQGTTPYSLIGSVSDVASGSTASITWSSLVASTEYEWYATVSDGHTTTAGTTWSFTTGAAIPDPTDAIPVTAANTDYAGSNTAVTMNFGKLPASGGTVTIVRHNSVPPSATYGIAPAGSAYLPLWLDITSTIPNHSFAVTVTVGLTGISGFDESSTPMFYSSVTSSWVPMKGTYNSGAHTYTFTTTHFTPFAFVTKPSTTHELYIASSTGATASSVVTPDNTWRAASGVTYYDDNDWSWTGTQSVSVFLVPAVGSSFQSADIMLEWDNTVMTYAGTEFTGLSFTSPTATLQAGSTRLQIQGAGSIDFTTTSGQYIAKVNFTVTKPGHSQLAVIKSGFTKASSSAVFVIPLQAEVKAYLGDVASSGDASKGDGVIDINDLSAWSASYWSGVDGGPGLTNYMMKYDIGSASGGYVFTLPTPDTKVNFEDLVMFSIGYGLSAQYQLPKTAAQPEKPVTLAAINPADAAVETRIPIKISGGVEDVRAVSLVLTGRFGRLLGVEKGNLLQSYTTPVMLMSRTDGNRVYVDMAIMGLDANSLNSDGEVVVLRFEGAARLGVTSAECRTSQNSALAVEAKGAEDAVPTTFDLSQNYPNPFNPSTVLQYQVPAASQVEIDVYNILGEKITTLVNDVKAAGYYSITWNGTGMNGQTVATGVYIYRMRAGDFVNTKRMLLIK